MSGASRQKVLALYKSMLTEAKKFSDYNFRMYAIRRTRDSFRENKSISDSKAITSCVDAGKHKLELMKRQVIVGQLYGEGKLVIETQGAKPHPG